MARQPTQPHFGDAIRTLRLTAGLSQEALAERAGLSARSISDLERGLRPTPRLETIRQLADALELDPTAKRALFAAARSDLVEAKPIPPVDRPPDVGQA